MKLQAGFRQQTTDHLYIRDRKAMDIILEEAQDYFTGAQTVQNVQEHIQSRIVTMLNEWKEKIGLWLCIFA